MLELVLTVPILSSLIFAGIDLGIYFHGESTLRETLHHNLLGLFADEQPTESLENKILTGISPHSYQIELKERNNMQIVQIRLEKNAEILFPEISSLILPNPKHIIEEEFILR